jgi:CMP/dCMP kinase
MAHTQTPKKHIITIAGGPGSGKSTAAKAVAAQLGLAHLSGGDIYRMFGKERGLDILQANLVNEKTGEIDRLVDDKLREINTNGDHVVIDSRTAWHFIPTSYKVFLDVGLLTAATRILSGMDEARIKSEHIPAAPKEYAEQLKQRLESETRKYKALYNIEPFDKSNYDLVIDTGAKSIEQVTEEIVNGFQAWLES